MLKKKNEARITTEWLKQMKQKPNVWFYKIPDDSIWKKPFDVVWCVNWKATAIEFKFCNNKKKKPDLRRAFSKLEPHQVVNLNNFKVANWNAFVCVYRNETKEYIFFDFSDFYKEVWDKIDKLYFMLNNNVRRKSWDKSNDWR